MSRPVRVMLANNKGGCGKTTLAHHLVLRAADQGLRVLAIDTDRQGDLYRLLVGDDGDLMERPPAEWRPGCIVVYSPDEYEVPPDADYDLAIIDTAPKAELTRGQVPDLLIVPIDGVNAARNANETVADALELNVPMTLLVFNGLLEGGKRHARDFDGIKANLPPQVQACRVEIPRGGSIKRSATSCRPAWSDVWKGADARAMAEWCDSMLTMLDSVRTHPEFGRAASSSDQRKAARVSRG